MGAGGSPTPSRIRCLRSVDVNYIGVCVRVCATRLCVCRCVILFMLDHSSLCIAGGGFPHVSEPLHFQSHPWPSSWRPGGHAPFPIRDKLKRTSPLLPIFSLSLQHGQGGPLRGGGVIAPVGEKLLFEHTQFSATRGGGWSPLPPPPWIRHCQI